MTEAFDKAPRVLRLAGQEFAVAPPTSRDLIAVHTRMEALARAQCVSPLEYVLGHAARVPAAALALAVSEAIKLGSGGGARPSPDAVSDQYVTLEGTRWRLWYHVSRVAPAFTLAAAQSLVTDDTLADAVEALDAALNFRALDPNAPAPATGAG